MDAWHEAQIARVTKEFDRAVGEHKERLRAVLQVYKHTSTCTKIHRTNVLSGLGKRVLTEEEIDRYCTSDDLKG